MQTLSNFTTEENNFDTSVAEKFTSEIDRGWAESDIDLFLDDEKSKYRLINLANSKKPLSSVIFNFNIEFEIKPYASNGWTHKALCPFHHEKTSSFGYNSKDDYFFCFGCKLSGGAVQFLASIKKQEPIEIAKQILEETVDRAEILIELEDDKFQKIDQLLLDFSLKIFRARQNSKNKNQIDNITYNLDMYLLKYVQSNCLDFIELQARLLKLEEYINLCQLV